MSLPAIASSVAKSVRHHLGHSPLLTLMALSWIGTMTYFTGRAGYQFDGTGWAVMMVLVTIAAAITPNMVVTAFRNGFYILGALYMVGAAGFMTGEAIGHAMVVSGTRDAEVEHAREQKIRFDDARNSVATLTRQLATATEKLEKQNAYGASTSYDAGIAEADELAQRESKERGGCKAKCDAAKATAADLRSKKAIAIERETITKPDVERLTKELAEAKSVAGNTAGGFSKSAAHAKMFARIIYSVEDPTPEQQKKAEHSIGNFFVLIGVLGGALLHIMSQQSFVRPERKSPAKLAKLWAFITGKTIAETPKAPAAKPGQPQLMLIDPRSAALAMRDKGMCA